MNWPTPDKSLPNSRNAEAHDRCPIFKAPCLAVPCQPAVRSHVSVLLRWSRPHAITWAVFERIIGALKGVSRRWSRTHIAEEVYERFAPASADSDTAPAVVLIRRRLWILAALDHASPHYVLGPLVHAVRAVIDVSRAAATAFPTSNQLTRGGDYLSPARTSASPDDVVTVNTLTSRFDRRKSIECSSGQVFGSRVQLHRLVSMCASMMRRTSSAMEMPRRLASRLRKTLCGSVKEIICLVIGHSSGVEATASSISAANSFSADEILLRPARCAPSARHSLSASDNDSRRSKDKIGSCLESSGPVPTISMLIVSGGMKCAALDNSVGSTPCPLSFVSCAAQQTYGPSAASNNSRTTSLVRLQSTLSTTSLICLIASICKFDRSNWPFRSCSDLPSVDGVLRFFAISQSIPLGISEGLLV